MSKALRLGLAAATFLTATAAAAQSVDRLPSSALEWREMVPKAVYFAPAYGDWEKGAHGKYARIESGAKVPMHTHKQPYHAVVISGRMTNLLDTETSRVDLEPGDYFYTAGGRPHGHICNSAEPCLIYTHSDGAWDLSLVE